MGEELDNSCHGIFANFGVSSSINFLTTSLFFFLFVCPAVVVVDFCILEGYVPCCFYPLQIFLPV